MQPESQKSSRSSSHSKHLDNRTTTNQHGLQHHDAVSARSRDRGSDGGQLGQERSCVERNGERGRDEGANGADESDDAQEAMGLRNLSPVATEHPFTRYERASSTSPERNFVAPVLLSAGRKGVDSARASPIATLPNGTSS
jgi:hypothetical protein